MYTIDDLLQDMNADSNGRVREIFSQKDKPQTMSPAEVKKIFPHISFSDSDFVAYVPVKMCHSLPTVNGRGRCFTASTIARSYKSASDQLVNLDHNLLANSIGQQDRIIGHIKATAIPNLSGEVAGEIAHIPEQPMPLYALTCLFLRSSGVSDMIANHLSGKETWLTSMECGHDFREAEFYYDGEFIPLKDAESGMLTCVKQDHVKPYKEKQLSLCLGGRTGQVSFWGLGLTKIPADEGASILGIYAGQSLDVASKKIFYMPCVSTEVAKKNSSETEDQLLQKAEENADRIFREFANLEIIGETQPASTDGHKHYILSDLTILPAAGHDHYLANRILTRGTQPRLTGLTGTHVDWVTSPDSYDRPARGIEHSHLIDIALRGKYTPPESDSDMLTQDVSNITFSGEMEMKLEDFLKKLDAIIQRSSSEQISGELATLRQDVSKLVGEEEVNKRIEAEIASRIESGALLTKEVAEKQTEEAVKAKEEEHEAQRKQEEARQKRLELCKDRKINLEAVIDEEIKNADGKPLTIADRLSNIPLDDDGENEFKVNLSMWSKFATIEDEESSESESQQVAEAANRGQTRQIVGSETGGKKPQVTQPGAGRSRFAHLK